MAEKRMFTKTIVDSDVFLDMPQSAQNLYFHLNMRADDEGFINSPKKIMRMVGSNQNDIEILLAKRYLLGFESGVVVVKHWLMHNAIRADRVKGTMYLEEKDGLMVKKNGSYTEANEMKLLDLEESEIKQLPENVVRRKQVYAESDLPYSFGYKIRSYFEGKECPCCKKTMTKKYKKLCPSIQHNTSINDGGLHELGNISVICVSCNSTINNKSVEDFNGLEVVKAWESIENNVGCQSAVKVSPSIDKIRLEENSIDKISKDKKLSFHNFDLVKLTQKEYDSCITKYGETQTIKALDKLNSFIGSKGNKYKSHYHTLSSWVWESVKAIKLSDSKKQDNVKCEVF